MTAQGDDMGTERDEILTTAQAAAILKVPESTLKRWRLVRYGPRSFKVGRYRRYFRADVLAWAAGQIEESV